MNLQTTLKFVLITFISLSIFFISACKKDETPDRDKFLGTYNVFENCDFGTDSYSIIITTSSSENQVTINNLYDYGDNIIATVSGNDISFSGSINGVRYVGSGSISNSVLTINFTIEESGFDDDNCSATATKQ